ncbi:MAG: serine/threonine-protein kinase [Isosphaeraceae bacterium]|nr:serine/threonine-protein kinase [Isosphaeraceae bacterium]
MAPLMPISRLISHADDSLTRAELEWVVELRESFEQRWRAGRPIAIERAVEREPVELRPRAACELLLLEIELRRGEGESPDAADYVERFPELAELVREALEAPATRGVAHDVPTHLGKYRVMRPLGDGGQGSILLAVDPLLRRLVAIKIYHCTDESQSMVQAIVEGQALAAVKSRNVVVCLDLLRLEGGAALVMEYVRGARTLDEVAVEGLGDPRERALLVARAAAGVAEAHRAGLLHGDVKPRNILLGDDGVPRVIDFGMASGLITGPDGKIRGTPNYMAPEQARGEHLTERSDVFSLGAVLYHLLTRRMPYEGSLASAVEQARACRFDRSALGRNGVPRSLARVCLAAMERDPAARIASASEFAARLRKAIGAPEHDDDSPRTATRMKRRRRVRSIAVAVCGLAAVAAVWHAWSNGPTARLDAWIARNAALAEAIRGDGYRIALAVRTPRPILGVAPEEIDRRARIMEGMVVSRGESLSAGERRRLATIAHQAMFLAWYRGRIDPALDCGREGLAVLEPLREGDPHDAALRARIATDLVWLNYTASDDFTSRTSGALVITREEASLFGLEVAEQAERDARFALQATGTDEHRLVHLRAATTLGMMYHKSYRIDGKTLRLEAARRWQALLVEFDRFGPALLAGPRRLEYRFALAHFLNYRGLTLNAIHPQGGPEARAVTVENYRRLQMLLESMLVDPEVPPALIPSIRRRLGWAYASDPEPMFFGGENPVGLELLKKAFALARENLRGADWEIHEDDVRFYLNIGIRLMALQLLRDFRLDARTTFASLLQLDESLDDVEPRTIAMLVPVAAAHALLAESIKAPDAHRLEEMKAEQILARAAQMDPKGFEDHLLLYPTLARYRVSRKELEAAASR